MHESSLEAALRQPVPTRRKPHGKCLDELASARFAAGEMSPAERAEACEHLSVCSSCLDRVAALVQLGREQSAADSPARAASIPALQPGVPRATWRNPRALFALAASVLLASFIGLLYRSDLLPGTGDPRYREVRSAAAPSAVPVIRTPADGRELRRADLRFEWTVLDSGIYYEVELLSTAGDILWQERSDGTGSTPPESLYLEPGAVFYVWVRAHLNDGKTVKSPTVSFRILREK